MNAPQRILDTPERLRLRVEDYLMLSDGGALDAYTKTELIDGEIYVMNAQYAEHARIKSRLSRMIGNKLAEIGSELEAIVEVASRVADDSMPEPDIVVTRWRGRGPVPSETVVLAIEVSETTLGRDLGRKAELYAAAGIAEYWVVDLGGRRVVVHEHPGAEGYVDRWDVSFGGMLVSAAIEGLEIATDGLID